MFYSTKNTYTIPYSDHSSYNELIEFVKQIKIKKLVPIFKQAQYVTHLSKLEQYLFDKEESLLEFAGERREFSCIDCSKWWFDFKEVYIIFYLFYYTICILNA